VGPRTVPTRGLSVDGNISPQRRKKEERCVRTTLANCNNQDHYFYRIAYNWNDGMYTFNTSQQVSIDVFKNS